MTAQAWHVREDQLTSYLGGRLDALQDASVEQHLMRCASCRAAVRPLAAHEDLVALDAGWQALSAEIHRSRLPFVLRAARRCGLPEPTAVLLAATTALRTAWLASAVVALSFALVASHAAAGVTLWPFLLTAPLVPVLGVATAYGPAGDPLEGLIVTAPYGRARLILVRTAAVLVSCLPVALLLGLLLPGPEWVALAWLGPALAMVPVVLALAGFVGPRLAAVVVAVGWAGFVGAAARSLAPTWPVEAGSQLGFLLLAATAGAVLAARSRRTRRMGVAL